MTSPVDTLADVGPYGPLTPIGWASADLEARSRYIVQETQLRVAGAAEAILLATAGMEPTRAATLIFVAHSLRDTARLLARMQVAQRDAGDREEKAEEERSARRRTGAGSASC